MSIQAKQKIDYAVEEFKPEFNKTEVIKLMSKDGFGELNATGLFTTFRRIVTNKK